MIIDRGVLAAIGLGLNASSWGLPQGIGLRWSLPAATTIHDAGVALSNVPRGWPTGGYRIYRASAKELLSACQSLLTRKAPGGGWTTPYVLGNGISVDWASGAGATGATLADAIAAAGSTLVRFQGTNWGTRLVFASWPIKTLRANVRDRAFDNNGSLLQQGLEEFNGTSSVVISGPNIALVQVELGRAELQEICVFAVPNDPRGGVIHVATPITDVPTILATIPPSRRGSTNWSAYAQNVVAAVANIDARLSDVSTDAGAATSSGMPIVDLLLLVAVDPVIAELLGLLWWDTNPPGGDLLYWVAGTWNGVQYVWPVGPISEQPPVTFKLPATIGLSAWALPPLIGAGNGGSSITPTAAAINWNILPPALASTTAARYRAARMQLPFGTASATVAAAMADLASFTPLAIGDVLASSDSVPYRVRDVGFPEGYLGWSVTGYDLFGRPSDPVGVGPISIRDTLPPPPPSRIRAVWLDANAAGSATSPPTDPLMTAEHQAWLLAHPSVPSALYIGLDWPPSSASAAPTTREFRLYARRSDDVPRMTANLNTVTPVSGNPAQSRCVLDAALLAGRDQLVGGVLSDGRARFSIIAVAPSNDPTTWVEVANILQPGPISITASTDPPGTSTVTPTSSAPSYTVPTAGNACRLIASTKNAQYWNERVAIIPVVPPLVSTILDVVSDTTTGDVRTVVVDLATPVAHPNPGAGVYVESGSLQVGTGSFLASLVTLDAQRTLPVDRTTLKLALPSSDTTTFTPGASATYFPGVCVYLPHASYRNSSELRTFVLASAASANDSHAPTAIDDPVHAADPQWQENGQPRHGFESVVASPVALLDLARIPPTPPSQPETPQLASWPDLSGMASSTIRWMPTSGSKYVVMRATDASLYAFDRSLRASLGSAYGADETGETGNLLALTSPTTYPDPANPGSPDYSAIFAADPGLLRRIASLAGNSAAFVARMSNPLGSSDCMNANPPRTFSSDPTGDDILPPGLWLDTRTGELVFVDSLNGIGTTLYFYRASAVDAIGNRSTLGKSGTPIELRIKQLPRMPHFDAVRIGDMAVTVLWTNPSDGSIDRYQVYIAPDAATLASVDVLAPITIEQPTIAVVDASEGYAEDLTFITPPGQTPDPSFRWGWLGMGLPPTDLYISVVAEKDVPNGATLRSAPSVPMRIQPKEQNAPSPPQISSLTRTGATATIQFTLDQPWHGYLLELRSANARAWSSIGPFTIPTSLPTTISFNVPAGVRNLVRLRAQNGNGVTSAPAIASVP